METTYNITIKEFNLYKKECQRWVNKLGLQNWDILYCFSDEKPHCYGWVYINYPAQSAVIYLSKVIIAEGEIKRDRLIKTTAFHEVCEVLFSDLRNLAYQPVCDEEDIDKETHKMINTFQNVLFE